MARGSITLTKLKSVLKKLNSFNNKQNRPKSSSSVVVASKADDESSAKLHPVYVGNSRRRYLVSSDIIESALFRELAEQSGEQNDAVTNVSCEVVLFEHLLWMLENGRVFRGAC
ncbi:hypothetical protein F3Y22_tig00117048pilonHSYRG01161 [Hibiscus syriacus]|uniref:SAUR-like auxin-responsive protein family n=1 Tax=Hibiscus syriacus TaxID=106335 RepID=A0A6A2XD67_HIBSY|nr:auxin-responsive protein SAUR76-like [Hibiscus syriacus]KAE8654627.1 hypothetical protein F3Y22_tig00117048pilonHSYRG01161 [Hibiscus syriacus]